MNDYQRYETKHSYQDDLNVDPEATDPFVEDVDGVPVRATGLPPEDFRDELDDSEPDEDEELVHTAEEVSREE